MLKNDFVQTGLVNGFAISALSLFCASSTAKAEGVADYARSRAKAIGLLMEKERSIVNVAGNFTIYELEQSVSDPVWGLQVNVAPVSFFNLEAGFGGNNNKVTVGLWNDFFSYAASGVVYLLAKAADSDKSFSSIHDALSLDVRTNPPYKNSSLWAGAYVTPLPFLVVQPQFGVHFAKVSVHNKGDSLRDYEYTKVLPTFGIEARSENSYFGFRLHVDPHTDTSVDPTTKKRVESHKTSLGSYLGVNF